MQETEGRRKKRRKDGKSRVNTERIKRKEGK